METRNISITLETAKEWYNSDNETLKSLAIQAFTKDELESEDFKKFKSWADVNDNLPYCFPNCTKGLTKGQIALVKLNAIRTTLNKYHKMDFTTGTIYYPQIRLTTVDSEFYDIEIKQGNVVKVGTIEQSCGKFYNVFGGHAVSGAHAGLGRFFSDNGVVYAAANFGFLGCATKEIAKHMSIYFAREIFDAMYADFVDYKWLKPLI